MFLIKHRQGMFNLPEDVSGAESAAGDETAPIDPNQEVWAAGVTYLRSRDVPKAESRAASLFQKVDDRHLPCARQFFLVIK
jgi:2-dehydro-3-deoxy-D-arabinonate dehydratase